MLVALLFVGGALGLAAPAGAQVAGTSLHVTLTGGAVGTHRSCDGTTEVVGTGITLHVSRADASTNATNYQLTWGGTLVAGVDYQAPPATGNIPAGGNSAEPVTLRSLTDTADTAGTVTVDVTGPGVTPAHAELSVVSRAAPECQILDPVLRVVQVGSSISIPVGDIAPYVAPLVHDVQLQVVGELPPGTMFSDDFYPADRKLIGTPTAVGTFTFRLRGCLGDFCTASQTFTIDVVPVGSGTLPGSVVPPGSGAGTTPTAEPPAATGTAGTTPAATPVAAVPTYTG